MMGIEVPETCWAYHKCNKAFSDIMLVFLLYEYATMHGQTHSKVHLVVCIIGISSWFLFESNSHLLPPPPSLSLSLSLSPLSLSLNCWNFSALPINLLPVFLYIYIYIYTTITMYICDFMFPLRRQWTLRPFAVQIGIHRRFRTIYRSHLQMLRTDPRPLRTGSTGYPKTSVSNYHSTLLYIPGERRPRLRVY